MNPPRNDTNRIGRSRGNQDAERNKRGNISQTYEIHQTGSKKLGRVWRLEEISGYKNKGVAADLREIIGTAKSEKHKIKNKSDIEQGCAPNILA